MNWHGRVPVIGILLLLAVAEGTNTMLNTAMHQHDAPAYSLASQHKCHFLFQDRPGNITGHFSSPQHNGSYPSNITCRYQFRASPGHVVNIYWEKFVLEKPLPRNELCLRDYVLVIVIDYRNVQHVSPRYCGSEFPPNFKTLQRGIDVLFQSSIDSLQYAGFVGQYQFVEEEHVGVPQSIYPKLEANEHGCGGHIRSALHGGFITSPNYPKVYPAPVICNWLIRVPDNKQIFIKLIELSLTKTQADCGRASLSLIDGFAHYLPETEESLPKDQRVEFCGEKTYYKNEGDKSYVSQRNRLIVRFQTKKPPPSDLIEYTVQEDEPIGFFLVWTEVDKIKIPDNAEGAKAGDVGFLETAECHGFLCAGGDICFDENEQICGSRARYCIDHSLVCDGIPHCSERDNSDEENCNTLEIIFISLGAFGCVIMTGLICVCCLLCRKRSRAKANAAAKRRNSANLNSSSGGASGPSGGLPHDTSSTTFPLTSFSSCDSDHSMVSRILASNQKQSGTNECRSAVKELEMSPRSIRLKELSALPGNYHPYRQTDRDDSAKEPFLSNHVGGTRATAGSAGQGIFHHVLDSQQLQYPPPQYPGSSLQRPAHGSRSIPVYADVEKIHQQVSAERLKQNPESTGSIPVYGYPNKAQAQVPISATSSLQRSTRKSLAADAGFCESRPRMVPESASAVVPQKDVVVYSRNARHPSHGGDHGHATHSASLELFNQQPPYTDRNVWEMRDHAAPPDRRIQTRSIGEGGITLVANQPSDSDRNVRVKPIRQKFMDSSQADGERSKTDYNLIGMDEFGNAYSTDEYRNQSNNAAIHEYVSSNTTTTPCVISSISHEICAPLPPPRTVSDPTFGNSDGDEETAQQSAAEQPMYSSEDRDESSAATIAFPSEMLTFNPKPILKNAISAVSRESSAGGICSTASKENKSNALTASVRGGPVGKLKQSSRTKVPPPLPPKPPTKPQFNAELSLQSFQQQANEIEKPYVAGLKLSASMPPQSATTNTGNLRSMQGSAAWRQKPHSPRVVHFPDETPPGSEAKANLLSGNQQGRRGAKASSQGGEAGDSDSNESSSNPWKVSNKLTVV